MPAPTWLPSPRRHLVWWLALAACTLALPAAAQWKWRDAKGQVHASDIPPPRDIPDKDVMQKPDPVLRKPVAAAVPTSGVAASAAASGKAGTDPELESRRRLAEQEKTEKTKAEDDKLALQRKDNCQRAREQLNTLDSGQRVAKINASGEREFLTDEQRAADARRARQIIGTDCR